MNAEQLKGQWKQIKGKVKEQWGKLTDDDLAVIEGNFDRLVGRLQDRYGETKEAARAKVESFMDKLHEAGTKALESARSGIDNLKNAARKDADAGVECIGCAVCYAACDTVSWNPDYLGPAALNRAWTLVRDERDTAQEARLQAVTGASGCFACHTHVSCGERCPKAISPTAGIAGLKREAAKAAWRGRP